MKKLLKIIILIITLITAGCIFPATSGYSNGYSNNQPRSGSVITPNGMWLFQDSGMGQGMIMGPQGQTYMYNVQ